MFLLTFVKSHVYYELECLFGTESFVFQFAIQKVKDQDI
jgi:hypothetical protein